MGAVEQGFDHLHQRVKQASLLNVLRHFVRNELAEIRDQLVQTRVVSERSECGVAQVLAVTLDGFGDLLVVPSGVSQCGQKTHAQL